MRTLLEYLQENHQLINALCDGKGKCGKCKVKVENRIIEPNANDIKSLTKKEIEDGYILACQHEYQNQDKINITDLNGEILTSIDIGDIDITNQEGYGIIIDIGTTTIVAKLIELNNGSIIDTKTTFNPQITYGGDVITRIQFDTNHPHVLSKVIQNSIKDLINLWLNNEIKKIILCGNTTMIHLFNDINTQSLGVAPFTVPQIQRVEYTMNNITITTLPHISAYVGSDIVSGIYALDLYQSETNKILLDLGTNGELVAGNKNQLFATSTAAGPAFEGGGIECGGASIAGAIYKVDDQLNIYTIHNQKPTCICGTGVISIIAYLRRKGIINELGRFVDGRKQYDICDDLYITNKDIQNFLLAKSAVQVALEVVLEKVTAIDKIYISGGFGNKIEIDDLITLKIIPEEMKNKVVICKNTALEGTYKVLMNQDLNCLDEICQRVEYIDLSEYDDFEDRLIEGLFI